MQRCEGPSRRHPRREEHQPERFELVGGVVGMMVGGIENHDRIGGNIFAALRLRLRGTPGTSMCPDVFVRCGTREGRRTTTDDPVIVFEVLSDSTAKHDLIRRSP
jgi:Uma2 family endonuclease